MLKRKLSILTSALTMCVSSNGWGQWKHVDIPKIEWVNCVVADDDTLYVGATYGLFRSTDFGDHWTKIITGMKDSSVTAIARLKGALFAGAGNTVYRFIDSTQTWIPTDSVYSFFRVDYFAENDSDIIAGQDPGSVLMSYDTGRSWTYTTCGLNDFGFSGIVTNGINYYAATNFGFYWSLNNGACWSHNQKIICSSLLNAWAIAMVGDTIFVGTLCGVSYSTDTGTTWIDADNGFPDSIDVSNLVKMKQYLFAGTIKGVYFSTNDGNIWNTQHDTLSDSLVYHLSVCGDYLYAATNSDIWRRPLSDFRINSVNDSMPAVPFQFSLSQNYPNPFADATTISYSLPEAGAVNLIVYNSLGEEVATLVHGENSAGEHNAEFNAANLQNGIYYYRLTAGKFSQTGRMAVVR